MLLYLGVVNFVHSVLLDFIICLLIYQRHKDRISFEITIEPCIVLF